MQSVWSTSKIPSINKYKPGGTGICTNGKASGRIKKSDKDEFGRWAYQILDGKGKKEIFIISIYQCCRSKGPNTAYQQQMMMHTMDDKKKLDPRKLFYRDIVAMINKHKEQNPEIIPILLGDWNEEFTTTLIPAQLCDDFNLDNIFDQMHPDHGKFRTYKSGSSVIDFALAPPEIADSVTNFVYEPFLY